MGCVVERRILTINGTRINYIKVKDKLYTVSKISFYDFTVSAEETNLTIDEVPQSEVFDITDFKDFHVRLHNWSGNVVDLLEYIGRKGQ